MLGDTMQKASSGLSDALVSTADTGELDDDAAREYPDKLDPALLRIAGVCGLACIMAILDNTVVAVAQRTFIDQFGSTQAIVSWTMAGYMLAFATVIPITGWAADRFGTKRLFMGSILSFTVGSLLCAIAPNILLLIIFRVLQGIGGGMLLPLSWTILTREAGPKRVGRLMAIGGIPILLGPIGGPILGGWLIDSYGWKWIFLVNLPIGLATFVLAAILFSKDRPSPSEALDVTGLLLLSPGVAIFLCGVSSIPGRHTIADPYVWVPMVIGVTLITAFVLHARFRTDHPLIDLRLFKNPVVTEVNVTLLVFAAASVGATLLIPSYFQLVLHETPMQAGLHLAPVGLGALITLPIAGVYMDRYGAGKIVLLGLPVMAIGLGIFTLGVARQAHYSPILLAGLTITGLGVGCTTTPLSAALMQSLAPHQIARGTTLVSVNQQLGGSIGAALMAVVLTNQFTSDETLAAASKMASLQEEADRRGLPVDPAAIPRQALSPDFASHVTHNLSQVYTLVFVLAVVLVAFTIIPAAFLPRKPVTPHDVS
ncbi:MFS transporter [Mycobacterium sp. 852002-53434_SCH5985345]|uniref:DHA2 family efflux MFS transporter permease subunit n=1 Tax=unclassified Mycobacterium TaxID=2642494 RepID=UPI0007FD8E38|nr:DHA2 family efflux MFS transporter permease subunit [Mycobacterium sp. 852002-51613_SCH5001154]OBF51652.1 MFS transporter [Mycobacterium sp. 852002-53434_SCH5985345]OBF73100.1 MFS transporter [Mycobacterium sp. 852002-51613_SCH5001154]OBG00111.1 MFS transporter [Mycobacterium sp. 852014-52450_SCH5900713]